jgi:hypothetical protein
MTMNTKTDPPTFGEVEAKPVPEKKDTVVAWLTLVVAAGALMAALYNYVADHSSKTETNGVSRAALMKDLMPPLLDEKSPRGKVMAFEAIVSSLPQSGGQSAAGNGASITGTPVRVGAARPTASAASGMPQQENANPSTADLRDAGPAYAFLQTLWLTEPESPVKCYFGWRLRNLQIVLSDSTRSVADCGTYAYLIAATRAVASPAASTVSAAPLPPTPVVEARTIEKHSGMLPSGPGKQFSAPYKLCSVLVKFFRTQ